MDPFLNFYGMPNVIEVTESYHVVCHHRDDSISLIAKYFTTSLPLRLVLNLQTPVRSASVQCPKNHEHLHTTYFYGLRPAD